MKITHMLQKAYWLASGHIQPTSQTHGVHNIKRHFCSLWIWFGVILHYCYKTWW